MKYKVLGPRILLKVQKMSTYYPGTHILIAEGDKDRETSSQTEAVIEQLGMDALTNTDYGLVGANIKPGDKVHFSRHWAVRLKSMETEEIEYWIINAKDLLCVEEE